MRIGPDHIPCSEPVMGAEVEASKNDVDRYAIQGS